MKEHYKSQCFSNISKVTEDSSAKLEDASFLDAVSDKRGSTSLNVSLSGNSQSVNLDTGAEVSVISEKTMNHLNLRHPV